MLALLLEFDEIEQAADFRTEMAVRLEDFGGMLGGHSGTEDQPVCLVQRRDRLGADIVPLQTDHVDTADFRGVSLNEHVRGHVVDDSRHAADVAMGADPDELVQSDGAEMLAKDST